MSYPKDLEDYSDDQLSDELARRNRCRVELRCDYCERLQSSPPCRHADRHRQPPSWPAGPHLPAQPTEPWYDELGVRVDRATSLARLAMALGEVERATAHPDGRPETDTTHTVMLAMIAAEMAWCEGLDIGLVVQLAIVHDIVEAYAGDVNTARGLTKEEKAAKEKRERDAAARIEQDLGAGSWVVRMMKMYEQQVGREARFVRYVDKILPKLTHANNGGVALSAIGMTPDQAAERHRAQGAELTRANPSFRLAQSLFAAAAELSEQSYRERGKRDVQFWDWDDTKERLDHVSIGDAIAAYLEHKAEWFRGTEAEFIASLPGSVELHGYSPMPTPEPDAESIVVGVLERIDEEFGDPDGGYTEPSAGMLSAAHRLCAVIRGEYPMWAHEITTSETVDIKAWIRENGLPFTWGEDVE